MSNVTTFVYCIVLHCIARGIKLLQLVNDDFTS